MTVHRCFAEHTRWDASSIELDSDEIHYLLHVLRVSNNSRIKIFDGCGREAEGRVVINGKHVWIAEPVIIRNEPLPESRICLAMAILKGNRMDFVIEKATEIGISALVPFVSTYTVKRPVNHKNITARWKKIAISATRQCNSVWLPEIHSIADYSITLDYCKTSDLFMIATLVFNSTSMYEVMHQYKKHAQSNNLITLMIGPEGDFTASEVKLALDNGAIPVNLGKRVLRAETAALYGLSIIQYELNKNE